MFASFVNTSNSWFVRGSAIAGQYPPGAAGPLAFHKTEGNDDSSWSSRVVVSEYFYQIKISENGFTY